MRRKITTALLVLLLLNIIFAFPVSAHELWIQVDKEDSELKVEVLWGHIRDFLDNADHNDYQLFVRFPQGKVEELPLEGVGVQARAYLTPGEEGQYVFWAERVPSTFTPGGGVPTLSVQQAKTVFQVGEGPGTAETPAGMLLEIVPDTDLQAFSTGTFAGQVFLQDKAAAGANISAYGPGGETITVQTGQDGSFSISLDNPGLWLVKANVTSDEEGTLGQVQYEAVSRTATLVFASQDPQGSVGAGNPSGGSSSNSTGVLFIVFISGLLLGAAGTFFLKKPASR